MMRHAPKYTFAQLCASQPAFWCARAWYVLASCKHQWNVKLIGFEIGIHHAESHLPTPQYRPRFACEHKMLYSRVSDGSNDLTCGSYRSFSEVGMLKSYRACCNENGSSRNVHKLQNPICEHQY